MPRQARYFRYWSELGRRRRSDQGRVLIEAIQTGNYIRDEALATMTGAILAVSSMEFLVKAQTAHHFEVGDCATMPSDTA